MNKLKPGVIKKFNDKPELHPLMERENINLYLDACWRLGMAKSEIFLTSDLHSRKAISSVFCLVFAFIHIQVLTNLSALSNIASRHGFSGNVAPIGFLASAKEAPKWVLPGYPIEVSVRTHVIQKVKVQSMSEI